MRVRQASGGSRRIQRQVRAAALGLLGLLGVLELGAACGGDELPWLARRASEVRELELLRDVRRVELTPEEFREQAEENVGELDEVYVRNLAETYGRLGFFPIDTDLRPILTVSSVDGVGATYSPWNKTITLVGEVKPAIEVHEYVHALQDQHFDMIAYDGLTSDAFLARRAVVEGDAVLSELRFYTQETFGRDVDGLDDWPGYLQAQRDNADFRLDRVEYPAFFMAYSTFVYGFGLEYTAANLMGLTLDDPRAAPPPHDWGLEDELFTERPPATAQQVLRRDDADPVEPIGPEVVPAELADRLQLADWDILGEWYTYLLLDPILGSELVPDRPRARAMAAAWDGDRALFLRERDDGTAATAWISAWDDDAAASDMAAALALLHGFTPGPEERPAAGTAADGEPLWLERRGRRLIAVKNLDPDAAAVLAEAAFGAPVEARAPVSRPARSWWPGRPAAR